MNDINKFEKVEAVRVRKALPKIAKLNNQCWQAHGGVAGTNDCSAGCQQTLVNKTCRC